MLRMTCQALLGVVEPANLGFGGEDHRVDHERPGELLRPRGVARGLLRTLERLQLRERCVSLRVDDLADVHPRERRRDGQLDRQLVPSALSAIDGGAEPRGDLGRAGPRDRPVDVTVLVAVALDHEAVAFETVQRVVDLADVQGPRRSGAALELGAQLISVARALIEDREQALTNGHVSSHLRGEPAR